MQRLPVKCPKCGSVEFVHLDAAQPRPPWRAFRCVRCHLDFGVDLDAFAGRAAPIHG